ncbi:MULTISPECIES: response regulator transcription factor [Sphingomonas]|uniref:FixJ family two-component response regulator n=1 Tax=Sphingomonas trueperi TaxID=53317 RepID=A0A7X5Y2C9_9SPHN|nr:MULTISPECIES: response regulator transcription factor [Sphingomonas]NJB99834.1 FixJ family two-component response regulator [Sphingomonas trueperi]
MQAVHASSQMSAVRGPKSLAGAREDQPVVIVIDDDDLVRTMLHSLLRSVGFATRCYGSPQEALHAPAPDVPGCIVLDVRMPQMSGFELRERLKERGWHIPIIFMTGHGDIPMSVKAMKQGAIDFLPKPFRDQDMIDAVATAISRAREHWDDREQHAVLQQRWQKLTPREREVLQGVTRGLLNKQIAAELGLAEITVKLHRASMLRKMGVRTVPDLVRSWTALQSRTLAS